MRDETSARAGDGSLFGGGVVLWRDGTLFGGGTAVNIAWRDAYIW